jgi:hypothetical protein
MILVSGSGEREWMAIVSLDAQEAVNGDGSFGLAESSLAPEAKVRQIALYPPFIPTSP